MEKLLKLKTELSDELKKPKTKNIKGEHDKREPRSEKKIKELQDKIYKIKNPILPEKNLKNVRVNLV
jgi:hypothetical protein